MVKVPTIGARTYIYTIGNGLKLGDLSTSLCQFERVMGTWKTSYFKFMLDLAFQ